MDLFMYELSFLEDLEELAALKTRVSC